MSRSNRAGAGLLAAALAGSLLSAIAAGSPAAAEPTGPTPAPTTAASAKINRTGVHHLTLVTGDRVTVSGDGNVTLLADPARPGVTISTFRVGERLLVIPSDAKSLLATGRLDERLFDVDRLIDDGFAKRSDLPLIVTHDASAKSSARRSLTDGGASVARELPAVQGLAVKAGQGSATSVWNSLTTGTGNDRKLRSGITKVWLDGIARTTLNVSVPQIGAPTAWAAGYDGTGVKVAVLDSGIDDTHPDLTGKVVAAQNFTTESGTGDAAGHGTHVASTIAGSGAASGGANRGVAPGASLLNGKVCTGDGQCQESAMINGMTWAAQQGADVINMSLGGMDGVGIDPLEQAVNNLTASHGTLFVVASGNSNYPRELAVSSPGSADAALTVGAVDPGDNVTFFSNQGPRVGDTALKPDITAPGSGIVAARSSTSPGSGPYTAFSGTSMATPHVAGSAAILAQRRPTWTPAQLKSGLMNTSSYNPNFTTFQQGAGRVDVGRAYNQTILTSPPSLSFGRQQWPHSDDPVLTRTVTYTNNGTDGVGLTLSMHSHDPAGNLAPAGMFTLSATHLSIPAGGTASVTVTADTRVNGADGYYGGYVKASGAAGGIQVLTPFAVHRGNEGYEISFTHLNRAGQAQGGYEFALLPLAAGKAFMPQFGHGPGPLHMWVEKGTYMQYSRIPEPNGRDISVVVNPRVVVNGTTPTAQTVDARGGQPVAASVPATTRTWSTEVGAQLTEAGVTVNGSSLSFQDGVAYTKRLGSGTVTGLLSKIRIVKAVQASGRTDLRNAPTAYNLGWFQTGTFPTGFSRSYSSNSQLSRVNAQHGAQVPGSVGFKDSRVFPSSTSFTGGGSFAIPFDLPFNRTEYFNTDNGVRWQSRFSEQSPTATVVNSAGENRLHTAGTTITEPWNKPVIAPVIAGQTQDNEWASRRGDRIEAWPTMVGDSGGHAGHGDYLTASSVLRRGAVEVNRSDAGVFISAGDLPPELTTYTLESTVTRGVELSTRISSLWTFQSSSAPADQYRKLPLWWVAFSPALNASNAAPRNTTFAVPLTVGSQPGSPVAGLSTVAVEYSTNDGTTWQNATLTGSGNTRTASIAHPNAAGFVSLRATATDLAGNSVTQTVIRAYKIA